MNVFHYFCKLKLHKILKYAAHEYSYRLFKGNWSLE